MRRIRATGLLFALLGSTWALVQGADSAAISALKEVGLAKTGRTFVIEAEKPVLDKIKEVKAAIASYAAIVERQAVTEQVATHLTQLEERRVELQEHLTDLNQRIIEQGQPQGGNMGRQGGGGGGGFPQAGGGMTGQLIAQRDMIKANLAEIKQEQQQLKVEAAQVKERSALDADAKKRQDDLKASLAELRPMIDGVTKKYADLGADKSVKAAINELERASKASLKLGPSDPFLAGVKAIDQAEQRLLGKKATAVSRKKAKARK